MEDKDETLDPSSTKFDPLKVLYSSNVCLPDPTAESLASIEQYNLDPRTENFDSMKALYSAEVLVPVPNAPVMDNLNKYLSASKQPKPKPKLEVKDDSAQNKPGPSNFSGDTETPARRFLPHQQPVRGVRPKRADRNVLSRMRDTKEGPLSVLKDCMERRIRIKVFTRHMTGVRGYCVAFVVAFDKHWNLALEDVTEVWTRKKIRKMKVPALGPQEKIPRLTWDGRPRPQPPRVVVRKSTKKSEVCERHIPQLMIRGEQIAIIAVLGY